MLSSVKAENLLTRAVPDTLTGRIIQFPLMRILIAVLFLTPVTLLHLVFEQHVKPGIPDGFRAISVNIETIIGFILMILAYRLYAKYVEMRKAHELSIKTAPREFLTGLTIGGGLMVLIVIILALPGCYRITGFNSDGMVLIKDLLPLAMAAFVEEILFRVIIFKLTEELLGSRIAIIIQAGLFGLAHLGNEHATLWAATALAIEAGIILAAAYMYTRRIWLAFGIHLGWNYFQAYVFGITTSGETLEGLIEPEITGPEWLTGGNFGVETSVVAVLLCLTAGIIILKMAVAGDKYVLSVWNRKKSSSAQVENY